MNWGAFDLNLLIVFDAVMQERSVTRAGNRIGLSQPAMSHALNRLRYLLKDELFVRMPEGMVPTPRAEQLALPLRGALDEMQRALEPVTFDPAVSNHRFSLAVSNHFAVVLGAPLAAAVQAAAPAVQLDMHPSGTSELDVFDRLDRGDLDLMLGYVETASERFARTTLLEDRFVMVMRRGHPASQRKLSLAAFAELSHLEISSNRPYTEFVDRRLAEHGLTRNVALRVPLLSTVAVLVRSDLVAITGRTMAQEFVRDHPLTICELPFEQPSFQISMVWHKRLDGHPAHRWLRDLTASVTRDLRGGAVIPYDSRRRSTARCVNA